MDLNDILAKAADHLTVSRAFGAPVERDGTLVIPVAIVVGGGGGGQGTDAKAEQGEGGGFGGFVYPLGVYTVRQGQVRFVPSVNVTRIIAATMVMVRVVSKRRPKVVVEANKGGRRCRKSMRAHSKDPHT